MRYSNLFALSDSLLGCPERGKEATSPWRVNRGTVRVIVFGLTPNSTANSFLGIPASTLTSIALLVPLESSAPGLLFPLISVPKLAYW